MKMLIAALIALTLSGCEGAFTPEPVVTKSSDASKLVESIIYVKAKNGICFGVTGVGKLSTGGHYNESQMVVVVDCGKVNL